MAPATRARILAAAEALGYQPNAIASGLITKRSNLVAVLIAEQTKLFYPEVLHALAERLSQRDMRILLFTLQSEADVDAALDQVWRYQVDGAIAAARLTGEHVADFVRRRIPVVLYNRVGESAGISSVCCDSVGGERLLVERLVAAGHRRFGVIAGPSGNDVGRQRVQGALERLAELGLEAPVSEGAFDYASGAAGLRRLMALRADGLDAVICANDLMAIGAIDAARTAFGLKTPDDLSIVGFDGVEPAHWASYRLTTMRQPVGRMAEAAVGMLMERIEDPDTPAEARTFTGELVAGASARLA